MTSSACWQVTKADLEPYLERVRDGALRHALEYGVAFLHETQAPAEQEVVNTLFSSGAIQVCCCSWKALSGPLTSVPLAHKPGQQGEGMVWSNATVHGVCQV